MDLVLKTLKKMRMETAKGFKDSNDQYDCLRQEIDNTNKKIQLIKKEMKKEAEWQKQKN